MPDDYCCEAMKQASTQFDLPFQRPIAVDQETLTLKVVRHSVTLVKLTPGGQIGPKSRTTVYIKFCPFCGKNIEE